MKATASLLADHRTENGADTPEARAEYETKVFRALRDGWSIHAAGAVQGSIHVLHGFETWSICDNGGEFNVYRVNSAEMPVSVPYVQGRMLIPPGRAAYFIAMAIKGEAIDYNCTVCDDLGEPDETKVKVGREAAIDILSRDGQTEGDHHKQWVLDQIARALLGDEYDAWVVSMQDGEDGPNTYDYDTGIAP